MSYIANLNKKIKGNNKLYWLIREWYVVIYSTIARMFDKKVPNTKKRILFYHIRSLGFGGTEKMIQIISRHLDKKKYDVFFLYPNDIEKNPGFLKRLEYIKEGGVIGIPFEYKEFSSVPPHFVSGMNPDIKKLIETLNIDLLIIPDAGNANYPFSIIKTIPVILLNIFGQPNMQENIKSHICISKEVADKISMIVPKNKISVFPIPSEGPTKNSAVLGKEMREKLEIKDTDFVFGRIGRPDDGIFDPIGIKAFQKIQNEYPGAHYIIMSPPPILVDIVGKEKIKNVHFLKPSSKEDEIWAFHQSLDCLAHFRFDGESFGLNIAESMLCGKPIISHKSTIWNAHLEYLDNSFSRVADINNVDQYAGFMKEMIEAKKTGKITVMGEKAKEKAEKLFIIKNNISGIEKIIDNIL